MGEAHGRSEREREREEKLQPLGAKRATEVEEKRPLSLSLFLR